MNKIPDAPKTVATELNKAVQDIMYAMRETYAGTDSYKSVMLNLKTVSKELHNIRINEIYPPDTND